MQRCNTKATLPLTISQLVISIVGFILSMILLWKEDDQLRFKKELKILTIIGAILIVIWISSIMVTSWPTIIRASVISEFAILIFFICTIIWPVISVYQRSRVTMKEKKECVNESQIDALELCLQHDIFYKSFEKYFFLLLLLFLFEKKNYFFKKNSNRFAMESWCIENLYFYERATQYFNSSASSMEEEAKLISANFLQSGIFHFHFSFFIFHFSFFFLFISLIHFQQKQTNKQTMKYINRCTI